MGSMDSPHGLYERDTYRIPDGETDGVTLAVSGPAGVSTSLPPVGDVSRYETGDLLGEGGMGAVWVSRDRQIGRRVAMKVVKPEMAHDPEAVLRFLREARVQGQLEHPAVVPVYDVGTDAHGAAYFTMKRVRGVTLEEIVRARRERPGSELAARFGERKLLTAFAQVCLAVDFAHRHGVLHRDLKPENIMLGEYGEVYVLDWGVAKILSERDELQATGHGIDIGDLVARATAGTMLGTPAFMAPEQLAGELAGNLPGADVYALGAILFEMLTGQTFNHGATVRDLIANALGGIEARPSVRCPGSEVAPELEEILVRATARQPEQRYRSARALHDAIERYLDGQRSAELRQELARQHALQAAEAVVRLEQSGAGSIEERRQAMQEVGRALALDPGNEQAVDSMVRLLTKPPDELPLEVRQELHRSDEDQWRWTGRVAGVAYLSFAMYLPLFLWSGILSVWAIVAYQGLAVVSAALALRVGFARHPRVSMVFAAMIVSTLCQASTFALFGPLVLTPALVATNTSGYAMLLRGWRRVFAVAFACLVLYGLVMLDLLDIPFSRYVFTGAGMTIKPGAIGLKLAPTVTLLGIAALGTVLTASLAVSRIRDSLDEAERKLYLYAWQIRQLVPSVVASTGGATAAGPRARPRAVENPSESG